MRIAVAGRTTFTSIPAERTRPASREWHCLVLGAAGAMALLDAALLERKHGFFLGGFLAGNQLRTLTEAVCFVAAALLLNVTVMAAPCAIALVVARRLRLRKTARRFAGFAAAFIPLAAADALSYQVWSYLGDEFDFALMFDLVDRRVSEILAVSAPFLSRPAWLGLLLLLGVVVSTWLLHRLDRGPSEDVGVLRGGGVFRNCLQLSLASAVVLTIATVSAEQLEYGLRMTPAGQMLGRVMNRLSDLDGDGYGVFRLPRDQAPFSRAIHPYALEVPGNGIDEDGLGGDLAADDMPYTEPQPFVAEWKRRPPVVLFVLESFRADVVGARHQGRPVTPVLDQLAADGLKVDQAWSHNGFTSQSRFHILAGSLADRSDGTSLLDDFKRQGYEVAYFSAQNDTFGEKSLNYDAVDLYYDARQDRERRYTTYATPGSLAVPLDVIEGRINHFLESRRTDAPLFLYVNFHDTHYPYTHVGVRDILGVPSLAPNQITPSRREQLWSAYLNTAANVDRSIGRVIEAVARMSKQVPAALVLGDHGESLFDEGFLGHGYALNEVQTRVPFIAFNLPLRVQVPFGQIDLRGAVLDALSGNNGELTTRPVAESVPHRFVFQYLGSMEAPRQIGWVGTSERLTYDFRRNLVHTSGGWTDPRALDVDQRASFEQLVHTWERIRLAQQRARARSPQLSLIPHVTDGGLQVSR